jgi:hypothetical protein
VAQQLLAMSMLCKMSTGLRCVLRAQGSLTVMQRLLKLRLQSLAARKSWWPRARQAAISLSRSQPTEPCVVGFPACFEPVDALVGAKCRLPAVVADKPKLSAAHRAAACCVVVSMLGALAHFDLLKASLE